MDTDRWLRGLADSERGLLWTAIGLGTAAGAAAVVAAVALAHAIARAHLEDAGIAGLAPLVAIGVAAAGARAALAWGSEAIAAAAAARVRERLRQDLLEHIAHAGPVVTGRECSGELATTAVDGVDALDGYLSRYLPQAALAATVPTAVAVAALLRDPLTALILALSAPLIPLFMWLLGRWTAVEAERRWRTLGRLGAAVLDLLQGLDALVLIGRATAPVDRLRGLTRRFRRETMAVLRIAFLSGAILELVATLSTAVVAVAVGLRLLAGRLALVDGLVVLLLCPEFYAPLRRFGTAFHLRAAAVAAADRIRQLLVVPAPLPAISRATLPMPSRPTVTLKRAVVRYPPRAPGGAPVTALDGVDLELRPGTTVALVGPSGAGKSTLVAALLRLVGLDSGELTADWVPAHAIDVSDWRRSFAWVPQSPAMLEESFAAHLRLARPDADDAALLAACDSAGLGDLVRALPDGLDSTIGELAWRISGGEARRIAIARALLAASPILLLDEAVEGLDPDTVEAMDRAIAAESRDRATLVIAHRLATVRRADRVVMLDRGRVVEQGSHDDLVSAGGRYAALLARRERA